MRPLDDSSSRGRQNIADPPPIPSKPRSRSQGAGSRRVAPASGAAAEKSLPNGDLYTGAFAGKTPHGAGKYLWADGCVYEGEWRRGEPSGKGKFTWPSGAVFNGEFRAGRMDGSGVLIGGDGESYEGGWKADKKHGYGTKRYANGDTYEGHWRRDLQHGDGRYTWRNGDRYLGEWRDGAISGRGALTWADGNNYNGRWENGVPKGGGGVFTLFPGEEIAKTFPRICIWESDGDDITCDIVDTLEVYRDGAEFEEKQAPQSRCFAGGEVKKQGEMISKGHKNYDLMLNLQLGIRYSVGRPASTRMRELKPGDFDPREKFWTRFPPEGSKFTPPHQSVEFRWKDYCPMVFRYLRKLFLVDPADYMLAICGDDALRELSSPGKSGSFFYLTQDDRFMIKTVKKSEVKVLIRMLSSYYQHVCKYENSLVTKFFGVHCVKPIGGQKVRFIIMGNLFCSEYRIHRRFDLKGSSHGRTTDKAEGEIDETTTLKDLDLNFVFRLQNSWFNQLIGQIDLDCEFLEAERIMDYSLLVGLHFRDDLSASKIGLLNSDASSGISTDSYGLYTPSNLSNRYNNAGLEISEKNGSSQSVSELQGQNMELMLDSRRPLVRLGANMPARAEPLSRESESIFEVVLYFGIIDILQDYDISKRLEHAYKSLQADPTSISAVDPKLYSRRFRDFIYKVFLEDE